jgi:hypothetical protein
LTTAVTSSALVFPYLLVAAGCGVVAWFAAGMSKGLS